MQGSITVKAASVEVWEEARPHVLAVLLFILDSKSVKILEDSTGCVVRLSFNQANRAFAALLPQLRSKNFPVSVKLGIILEAKNDRRERMA